MKLNIQKQRWISPPALPRMSRNRSFLSRVLRLRVSGRNDIRRVAKSSSGLSKNSSNSPWLRGPYPLVQELGASAKESLGHALDVSFLADWMGARETTQLVMARCESTGADSLPSTVQSRTRFNCRWSFLELVPTGCEARERYTIWPDLPVQELAQLSS